MSAKEQERLSLLEVERLLAEDSGAEVNTKKRKKETSVANDKAKKQTKEEKKPNNRSL